MTNRSLGIIILIDRIIQDVLDHIFDTMPALPDQTLDMLTSEPYHLTTKDAKTLLSLDDGSRLDYYLAVIDDLDGRSIRIDGTEGEVLHMRPSQMTIGKTVGNW